MKKFFYVFMVMVLVAFAGCAFAAGHTDPEQYKPIEVTNVSVPDGVTVESVTGLSFADAEEKAKQIGDDVNILGGFTLDLEGKKDQEADITVSGVTFKATGAYILSKSKGTYTRYEVSQSGRTVTIKNVQLDDHFSAQALLLSGNTSSGGSSSGCNAGFAALLLLAATPICFFRKK